MLTCIAEKTGISRAREALEANDWAQLGGDLGSEFGDFEDPLESNDEFPGQASDDRDLDPESLDFGFDQEDFAGLKKAIWSAGQDDGENALNSPATGTGKTDAAGVPRTSKTAAEDKELGEEDVQKLESMMRKLQAVKDMSVGLPEDQRKRMAAKAVGEVMKDF
jgi:alpha- and gamma-adaptin-binding protein p34